MFEINIVSESEPVSSSISEMIINIVSLKKKNAAILFAMLPVSINLGGLRILS